MYEIAELLKKYPKAEFNIEGNPFIEYMHFIEKVKPKYRDSYRYNFTALTGHDP